MIAYVDRDTISIGDEVVVELRNSTGHLLTVMQVSIVTKVEPSKYHLNESMDEIEF